MVNCNVGDEIPVNDEIEDIIGNWYHLCVSVSNEIKLYVNGQLKRTQKLYGEVEFLGDLIYFGHASEDEELDLTFLNGRLDEIRIYNRTLKFKEITALSTILDK